LFNFIPFNQMTSYSLYVSNKLNVNKDFICINHIMYDYTFYKYKYGDDFVGVSKRFANPAFTYKIYTMRSVRWHSAYTARAKH